MNARFLQLISGGLLAVMLAGCGQQATVSTTTEPTAIETAIADTEAEVPGTGQTATAGADSGAAHGGHGATTSMASYDAQFIDSMIEHHTGAITMAEQALEESERPEIKQLAQNIIASQQQEVKQMTDWRTQWYPDLAPTEGMGMDMGDMDVDGDAATPFDQRFIAAMIEHHNGAIAMAKDAQTKAEHAEIKQLAAAIITAQETEVAQMQQWNQEWFGNAP